MNAPACILTRGRVLYIMKKKGFLKKVFYIF